MHLEGTLAETQGWNSIGDKAYKKKTFNKVRLQNLTSSGIRFGYYCCLTDLDKANLWGVIQMDIAFAEQ